MMGEQTTGLTVTMKEQFVVWPQESVAVQVTGVVPRLKLLPLDGKQLTFTYGDSTVVRDCKGGHVNLAAGDAANLFTQNGALELASCVHPLQHRDGTPPAR